MRILRRHRIGIAALGVVFGAAVAWATGGFDWDSYVSAMETYDLRVEHSLSNTGCDGPHTVVTARRGPVNLMSLEFTLSARVTIDAPDVLNSMQLQVAHDANHDGVIEGSEWESVATGTLTVEGNRTIAETPTVTRSPSDDGWRIRMDRTDLGVVTEEVIDEDLESGE